MRTLLLAKELEQRITKVSLLVLIHRLPEISLLRLVIIQLATGNSAVAIGGDDLDMVSKVGNDWNQSNTAKAYKRLTGDDLVGPTTYISTQAGDAAVAVGVQAKAGGALSTAFGTRTEATGIASLCVRGWS